jgi:acetoacetyl-CoA synthetase
MTVDSPKPLWTPSNPEKSQLAHFQNYIAKKYNRKFGKGHPNRFLEHELSREDSYDEFWRWSTNNVSQFWYDVFNYLQIKCQNPPKSPEDVVDETLPMFPRPIWFKDTCLNFAEDILFPSPEIEDPDTAIAIIEATEAGVQQHVTWSELRDRVAQFASALRAAGVSEGDRIGGTISNSLG